MTVDGPMDASREIDHWFLEDGTRVAVRALRSSDRALEIAFLESLSDRSRYFRLMTPMHHPSPDLLTLLLDVNGESRAALVAMIGVEGDERCIAIARYAHMGGTGSAELGITVTDAWQRRGIASHLIRLLMAHARRNGIVRFVGHVLPDNHAMVALAKKLGFELHFDSATRLFNICIETAKSGIA